MIELLSFLPALVLLGAGYFLVKKYPKKRSTKY